jgi:hypothetical protein
MIGCEGGLVPTRPGCERRLALMRTVSNKAHAAEVMSSEPFFVCPWLEVRSSQPTHTNASST